MKNTKKKRTQTMTATIARTQFFELVNAAFYQGIETVITKNGKEMARIVPPNVKKVDWGKRLEELKNFTPFLTDKDAEQIKAARRSLNKPRFPNW
ncbi:type II toxin-antitoxin system Phd/YefM family antitoxin [Patescibacteria group bacterium]|nr:type II toxin-antitoxin system Phd/YefM family antitoxin [Patescibacteria group bacterium]MBU1967454.1 type II toxin-antitoxin system Phd/YefM family antitoxin [Patescibacteria group bacterium]MBU2543555.1 type II toxin-antitoxin system Phd/YefM family antitoxin [Patescibacteria group bacterium]